MRGFLSLRVSLVICNSVEGWGEDSVLSQQKTPYFLDSTPVSIAEYPCHFEIGGSFAEPFQANDVLTGVNPGAIHFGKGREDMYQDLRSMRANGARPRAWFPRARRST